MTVVRALARPLLSTIFIVQGAKAVRYAGAIRGEGAAGDRSVRAADQAGDAGSGR